MQFLQQGAAMLGDYPVHPAKLDGSEAKVPSKRDWFQPEFGGLSRSTCT
jgi:hypothetical protein